MIEVVDDVISIANWAKYQNVERLEELKGITEAEDPEERKREQNRVRQQRYKERKKQKNVEVTQGNAKVTLGNALVTQNSVTGNAKSNAFAEKEKRSKKEKDSELETDSQNNTNTSLDPLNKFNYIYDIHALNYINNYTEERAREQHRLRVDYKRLYNIYPRGEGYFEAWEEFKLIWPSPELVEEMIAAVNQQKKTKQWQVENGRFVPQLRNWLKGRRWKDKPDELIEGSEGDSSFDSNEFIEAALNRGFEE
jgi:hypothetical protein